MAFFDRKKKSDGQAGATSTSAVNSIGLRESMGLPNDPDSPWTMAQRHMDDRFLRVAAHAENWRKSFFWMFAATVIMGVCLALVASQSRVEPIFIAVDQLGRTSEMAAGLNAGGEVSTGLLVEREMREFVESVRTVTSDYAANNKALVRGFSRLAGPAHGYVKNDLQSRKPNEVAENKTVVVDVKIAFPITTQGKQNTWQVEWSETSYDLRGNKIDEPEMWRAMIQYELRPNKTIEEAKANPLGFFIVGISWAKLK